MEFEITKRDTQRDHRKKAYTATPINGTHYIKLDKYISGDEKFKELQDWLQQVNCDLQFLEISKIIFTEQKAECLAKGLYENNSMLELVIKQCKIHSTEMQTICDALARHDTIQSLEFDGVTLTSAIIQYMGPMLQQNVSLRRLIIKNCGLTDLCLTKIAPGLTNNISLQELQLENALFEEEGLNLLVNALSAQFYCRKLKLGGVRFTEAMCQKLASLFRDPRCMITDVSLTEMETAADSMGILIEALSCLKELQLLSLNKNPLSVAMCEQIARLCQNHQSLQLLCLKYCQIDREKLGKLVENINDSQLKYIDLSWNAFATHAEADDIAVYTASFTKLLLCNPQLQKVLVHHNSFGHKGIMSFIETLCDKSVITAPVGQQTKICYLDISDTGLSTEAFRFILKQLNAGLLHLKVLECRKNNLDGQKLHEDCFQLLSKSNCPLNAIDLRRNNLDNECAKNIKQVCIQRIPFQEALLDDNPMIHNEIIEEIKNHCRMNFLIQKFIVPSLPVSKTKQKTGNKHFRNYDTRQLILVDEYFFKLDFAIKFLKMNKETCQTLVLKDVQTQLQFQDLITCFESHAAEVGLQSLHLINIKIEVSAMCQLIRSLKNVRKLKLLHLKHIKQFNLCLQDLYHSLRHHPSLKTLKIAENSLSDYKFLIELIKENDTIDFIDVRKNYINGDIVCQIERALESNLSLCTFLYNDHEFTQTKGEKQSIRQQMDINNQIAKRIRPAVKPYTYTDKFGNTKRTKIIDLKGQTMSQRDDEAIGKLCRKEADIHAIDLSKTDLTDAQLRTIVDIIIKGQGNIEILKLNENNRIEDSQAKYLAQCFQSKQSLKVLELQETNLKADGFYELIKALQDNTVAETLKCTMCRIQLTDPIRIQEIKRFVAKNSSLVNLDITGNLCGEDVEKFIASEITKNQLIATYITPHLEKVMRNENVPFEESANLVQWLAEKNDPARSMINPRASAQFMKKHSSMFSMSSKIKFEQLDKSLRVEQDPAQLIAVSRNVPVSAAQLFAKIRDATGSYTPHTQALQFDHNTGAMNSLQHNRQLNTLDAAKGQELSDYFQQIQKKKEFLVVNLEKQKLQSLDFLFKFISLNENIEKIDMKGNELDEQQINALFEMIKHNIVIQVIDYDRRGPAQIHRHIEKELEKNKMIQAIVNDKQMHDEDSLHLLEKGFQNIDFLQKYLAHNPHIRHVDLSNNVIGNEGCDKMAQVLKVCPNIISINLSNNNIGSDGLQTLCSALHSKYHSKLETLNIENNPINDKSLKMLLAMLLHNTSILDIKYSLHEKANQELWREYLKLHEQPAQVIRKQLLVTHNPEVPLWQKIVFPIWLWKSLMHDKHEAFAFKYDSVLLKAIEHEIMEKIGGILYTNALMFYFVMFFCPLFFVNDCGLGLSKLCHIIYIFYAVFNIVIEGIIVFWIQTRIQNKALLKFNKWHFIELVLGTIGKMDTYLDMCIFSLFLQCKEWHFVGPIGFFIVCALIYPVYRLSTRVKVNTTLSHTLPYMERNCQVCFLRENMLLATVLDSFCIDNNETIRNQPVHYGKLMGALTFFLQDFPQYMLHIAFLFTASQVPHNDFTVILSLVCSSFAICISFFNFRMQGQNDFNPIVLQVELKSRKERQELLIQKMSNRFKKQKSVENLLHDRQDSLNLFLDIASVKKESYSPPVRIRHKLLATKPSDPIIKIQMMDTINVSKFDDSPFEVPETSRPLYQAESKPAEVEMSVHHSQKASQRQSSTKVIRFADADSIQDVTIDEEIIALPRLSVRPILKTPELSPRQ